MAGRINLLPKSERTRTTTDYGTLGLLATAIIVVFAIGLGYYLLHNSLADKEQELAAVQQETASLVSQVSALSQYESLQAERVSAESVVQSIYASRTLVSEVLDAVSLVIPQNAWFQSLSLTTATPVGAAPGATPSPGAATGTQGDNKLSVEGNTYSFEDIAQVLVRLQLVPCLSDVYLVSAGQAKGSTDPARVVRGFSIEASVVNKQRPDTPLPRSQVEVESQ